jgi:hypothetical protein
MQARVDQTISHLCICIRSRCSQKVSQYSRSTCASLTKSDAMHKIPSSRRFAAV